MDHSFDVNEAVMYGVEKAVILHNFRFWLTKNMANNHNNIDGYYWTYNSATAFAKLWPYLNAKKISRLLKELEVSGALVTANHNKAGYDRTKWYSMPEFAVKAAPAVISQICEMDFPNMSNAFPKYEQPIPDSKPDKKPDSKHNTTAIAVSDQLNRFEEFWEAYPKKSNKAKSKLAYAKAIKKTSHELIIHSLINQKNGNQWGSAQFTPMATTWLNGERWEDDVIPSGGYTNGPNQQQPGRATSSDRMRTAANEFVQSLSQAQ